jgi:hypothetical protein
VLLLCIWVASVSALTVDEKQTVNRAEQYLLAHEHEAYGALIDSLNTPEELSEVNPELHLQLCAVMLSAAQREKDQVQEADCYLDLSYDASQMGDPESGQQYLEWAFDIINTIHNDSLLCKYYLRRGHYFKKKVLGGNDRNDCLKARSDYKDAEKLAKAHNYQQLLYFINMGLTYVNGSLNDTLQNFHYANLTFDMLDSQKLYRHRVYLNMGRAYERYVPISPDSVNYSQLSATYYKMALAAVDTCPSVRYKNSVFAEVAEWYMRHGNEKEGVHYARMAVDVVKGTDFWHLSKKSAELLYNYYCKKGDYKTAVYFNDILGQAQKKLDGKNLAEKLTMRELVEQLRREKEADQAKAEAEFNQSVIDGVIIVFVIALVIIFVWVLTKIAIPFLIIRSAVLFAALMLFEFVNLLVHPIAGNLLHHQLIPLFITLVMLNGAFVYIDQKYIHHWLEEQEKRKRYTVTELWQILLEKIKNYRPQFKLKQFVLKTLHFLGLL